MHSIQQRSVCRESPFHNSSQEVRRPTSTGYPRSHARNALPVRAGLTDFLVTATSVTRTASSPAAGHLFSQMPRAGSLAVPVVQIRAAGGQVPFPADAVLVVMSNTSPAAAQTISAMSPTPAEKLHTIGCEGTSEKVKRPHHKK